MPIHLSTIPKPKEGAACSNCGYCCSVSPCQIAREFLSAGAAGPCPALELDKGTGQTACGMIRRPLHYLLQQEARPEWATPGEPKFIEAQGHLSSQVAHALGAGLGCDSADDEASAQWPWPVMLHPTDR